MRPELKRKRKKVFADAGDPVRNVFLLDSGEGKVKLERGVCWVVCDAACCQSPRWLRSPRSGHKHGTLPTPSASPNQALFSNSYHANITEQQLQTYEYILMANIGDTASVFLCLALPFLG